MPPTGITSAQSRIVLGFGGFLTLTGAALLVFGMSFLYTAIASRHWPTAAGTIQKVAVVSELSSSGTTRAYTYHYAVTYEYGVNEQTYRSDRYSLGTGATASKRYRERSEALTASRDYPAGGAVTVYYDPKDPASAVLKPGANFGTYVPLVMGLMALPGGLALLVVAQKALRPQ
ncbi:MAG: DUF3592 domain-containing protein [Leptolyngbya sp. RL_3_1]|nr:DUF3592 domain-containing protein [Leptolyngbya sp. RL_3_1]